MACTISSQIASPGGGVEGGGFTDLLSSPSDSGSQ